MENPIIKKMQVTDSRLKKLLTYYLYAAFIFIVILLLGLITGEYARSLDETLNSLTKLRNSLIKISDFTGDMKKTIAASGKVIPANYFVDAPEKSLMMSLDTLKATMPNTVLAVSGFAATEGEVNLPVTMKGFVDDFTTFVNNIGKLQAMKFPFFSINGLVMRKTAVMTSDKKSEQQRVAYEIAGELRLPKEAQAAGGSAPPGSPPARKMVGR